MTTIENKTVLNRMLDLSSMIAAAAAKEPNQNQIAGLLDQLRQAFIEIDVSMIGCVGELTPLRQCGTECQLQVDLDVRENDDRSLTSFGDFDDSS